MTRLRRSTTTKNESQSQMSDQASFQGNLTLVNAHLQTNQDDNPFFESEITAQIEKEEHFGELEEVI